MTAFILWLLGMLGIFVYTHDNFEDYSDITTMELVQALLFAAIWPALALVGAGAIALDYWDYRKSKAKKKE